MRNPKELKDLIEKCKNETDEGQLIDNTWKRIEKSQIDLLPDWGNKQKPLIFINYAATIL